MKQIMVSELRPIALVLKDKRDNGWHVWTNDDGEEWTEPLRSPVDWTLFGMVFGTAEEAEEQAIEMLDRSMNKVGLCWSVEENGYVDEEEE